MARLQIKRGLKANLPSSAMLAGEMHFCTDTAELFVATDATTLVPVKVAGDQLATLGAIESAADLVYLYDYDAGEMKIMTFANFKAALNIPAGSSDEQVAVVSGGASGYIWGTDGTDGILRMNTSLSWTKDVSNGFVTIAVATVDGGTF